MVVVVVNLGQNLLAVALFVRAYASVSLFSGWSAILFFCCPSSYFHAMFFSYFTFFLSAILLPTTEDPLPLQAPRHKKIGKKKNASREIGKG